MSRLCAQKPDSNTEWPIPDVSTMVFIFILIPVEILLATVGQSRNLTRGTTCGVICIAQSFRGLDYESVEKSKQVPDHKCLRCLLKCVHGVTFLSIFCLHLG